MVKKLLVIFVLVSSLFAYDSTVEIVKKMDRLPKIVLQDASAIDVDKDLKTGIDGLFAVGECANSKLHGANRLGGNSLLEIIVLGLLAGENAVKLAQKREVEKRIYEKTIRTCFM